MPGNGWACCNILFPVVCHTLTGQPTASTDTQRLHRNMDISKFSKRTLNFDISRFDCTCTRHENINNELLNTSQALCWLDTYDVVISHSELLWITCTVYNYDSSSQLSFSALAVFSRNALYKSTFYLLTYCVVEIVTLLLESGAQIKVKNALGWSPMSEAVSYGDRQISMFSSLPSHIWLDSSNYTTTYFAVIVILV